MTRLVHVGSGRVLADRLSFARTPWERMRGLLGRSGLPRGAGMMIERCASIHTFFMRFPIDVVFVDAELVVKRVAGEMGPWRLAWACGARHAIELPAGTLKALPVAPGDALRIEEPS